MKKNLFFICLLVFLLPTIALAQNKTYDIVSAGTGKDGNYLVKVSMTVEKPESARDLLKSSAVHGVIFKGVMGDDSGNMNHKPLITDPTVEQKKSDFFSSFFSDKEYERYVSMIESSYRSVKEKRKKYLVSATLMVDKESLLKYLEKAGVTKGFSSLW